MHKISIALHTVMPLMLVLWKMWVIPSIYRYSGVVLEEEGQNSPGGICGCGSSPLFKPRLSLFSRNQN